MTHVKLSTADDQEFAVPRDVAMVSVTVANIVEDVGDCEAAIPLMNVDAAALQTVLAYCRLHLEHANDSPVEQPPAPISTAPKRPGARQPPAPWQTEFAEGLSQDELFGAMLAANYLDIEGLVAATCHVVAAKISKMGEADMRAFFKVPDPEKPLSEEEIEAAVEANPWCHHLTKKPEDPKPPLPAPAE